MTQKLEWMSGGIRREHTVTKQTGESVSEFFARATAEFEAQLAEYPPD